MKCLLLAAGYATRLYPLTENFPKPLLKVGEKTILDWLIDDVDTSGKIDEYIIVTNHKFAHHFESYAKTKKQKVTVVDDLTSNNETRLGAVRDIGYAIDKLHLDDDLLVLAGDNVLDFSLNGFINYALSKKATCVLRYDEPDPEKIKRAAYMLVDENDCILEMEEKPKEPRSRWCCPPFYFYSRRDLPQVLISVNEGTPADSPGGFIAWLYRRSPVYAMIMTGKRYDIGNLESYEKVKKEYRGITKC